MRVEGSAEVVNYNSKPVQTEPVQVKQNVRETGPVQKHSENAVGESVQNGDMAQQIIAARNGQLPISEKLITEAIDRANKAIVGTRREFEYTVHKVTHAVSVKVIDSESKEVIREIPPEKILDLVAKMMELAGILVDEKR